jgi:hypothetical protein
MKTWLKIFCIGLAAIGVLMIAACNLPANETPVTDDPALLYTAAAQTVNAQLTQVPVATQPVLPTTTQIVQVPTFTLPPSNTPPPTATTVPPTATQIPIPCDRASYVEDVTYPDNSEVASGSNFTKTWRLKNTGTCTWNSGYALVFLRGDSMGGPASLQFTTGTVSPGQVIDVSVNLLAPSTTGTYQGFWQLRNANGVIFGIGADAKAEFWVKIKAVTPTPTATPTQDVIVGQNFVEKGPSAEWRNNTQVIPWGDPAEDDPGVAVNVNNFKVENNKSYDNVLVTYPPFLTDGLVRGTYPSYTVVTGDRFRALLGFRANCGVGKVRFQLWYKEGSSEIVVAEWLKICDGNLLVIDQDLASLVGKTVQFILIARTEGDWKDDKAIWVNPRIERLK